MGTFIDYCRRFRYGLNGFFLMEKDRIALWLPVMFGVGIGFYFSLPTEPLLTTTLCIFVCACFFVWDCRRNTVYLFAAVFFLLFCAGIFFTQLRVFSLSEPRIKMRTGLLSVTGTVQDVQEYPDGRGRLILKNIRIGSFPDWKTPAKIWLNLPTGLQMPQTNDLIETEAFLSTPYPAGTPDGFDFSRLLYFRQIGAIGSVHSDFKILKQSGSSTVRNAVNRKIDTVLPADTAGVAKALITGSTKSIPLDIVQNYRDAGIAHILSVSGLHMSLLAGLVFAVTRTLLALIPAAALYWNTKKIAAVISLIVCFAYLHLSGASYPAQRAFIMLAFALTAILFNRRALSVVSLAWAAFFILLFFPESVCSAGFQLSFAAVTALICAYEAGVGKYTRLLEKKESFLFYFLSCLAAIALTTIIASLATAPFTVFHFKRLPVYSLIGNLLSSSVTGLWVMPALTAGTIMMPVGMEKPFLTLASYGISLINRSAEITAGLPHAVYQFPPMPFWGLMMAVFGGLWACLWQGRHRLWGLAVFCCSLTTPFFTALPDMYVSLSAAAFRNKENMLVFKEGSSDQMMKKAWLEENRQEQELTTICPYGLCLYEKNGLKIGYAHNKIGAYDACQMTDLDALFITEDSQDECPAKHQYSRSDILKAGAYTVYARPDGLKILSVAREKGYRPWTVSYPLITFSGEIRNMTTPVNYKITARLKQKD